MVIFSSIFYASITVLKLHIMDKQKKKGRPGPFFCLFVDGINRYGAVIILEGRDSIRSDLDVLERDHAKLMAFSKARCSPALG